MAYNNRRFFPQESVEDKTKKYTRPHAIVTSHLRNLQQSRQMTPPIWMSPRIRVPITYSTVKYPNQSLPVLPNPQFANHQTAQVLAVQKQLMTTRKRQFPTTQSPSQVVAKKKYERNPQLETSSSHLKDPYVKLTSQIKDYSEKNAQSDDLLQKKLCLRSALLQAFRREVLDASLHLVGSSCNGFASTTSDADFCLMLTQNRAIDQKFEACLILRQLQKTLRTIPSIRKVLLIRAKVPILKFTDTISGCECDVNVNNSTGIRNTHLLRSYSKVDDRVSPLVVMVKHWAKTRQINDAASGMLNSYSLVLMVIHYLQCGCSPAVLLSLQKDYPRYFSMEKSVDELPMFEPADHIPRNSSNNKESLGELFCGFFKYFVEQFKWDCDAASIRLGCRIQKNRLVQYADKFIGIEEPFDRTNTARTVYNFDRFKNIKNEFQRAYDILHDDKSLEAIL